MSLTVDAEQLAIAQRSAVLSIPLVMLETFTDRDAQTVGVTRYWTRTGRAVRYKWDGANDQTFEPLIQLVSPISRGFNHLPDAESYDTREAIELSVDGSSRANSYLWKTLLDENIIGARVTVASILVDADHDAVNLGFSSAKHVVRWRGEVTQLSEIQGDGSTFSLLVESKDAKLGSAAIAVGQSGESVPVLYDETIGLKAIPVDLARTGTIQGVDYGVGSNESLRVLWDGNDYPHGFSGIDDTEDYPPVWSVPYSNDAETDESKATFNIWGGFIYDGLGNRRRFYYERVDNPGANGAPQVDLEYTERVEASPSFAVVGNRVHIPKFFLRWAVAGGYVKSVRNVSWRQTGGTAAAQDMSELRWWLWTDTSDPQNVVTYLEMFSDRAPTGDTAALPPDHNDLSVAADYEIALDVVNMWEVPTGAWSTIVDGATYTVADVTTAAGHIYANSGSTVVSPVAYQADLNDGSGVTQRGGDTSEAAAIRVSDEILVYQTTARLGLFAEFEFDVTDGLTGDREFDIALAFDGTTFSRMTRIYVTFWASAGPNDYRKGRVTDLSGEDHENAISIVCKTKFDLDWDGFGTNIYRVRQAVMCRTDSPYASQHIRKIRITAHYNQESAANAFFINEIRHRPLTQVNQANHPLDMVETIVDEYLPDSALTVDSSSFSTAKTNVPDVAVTPDLSRYPNLGELLSAVGFAGRTNFVYSETASGTVLKAFAAESDYSFPAASKAIGSVFTDMQVTVRPITEIATRFNWVYDLPSEANSFVGSDYARALRATPQSNPYSAKVSTSSLESAEAAFGVRETIVIPIEMLRDEVSIVEVTGYYASESIRGQVQRLTCVVPYWIGYDLEPGDVVSIRPAWETGDLKVRVCRTVYNFDANGIGLVLEAVN